MADNRNDSDGYFHWNFDLGDADSDFTDIEYSDSSAKEEAPAVEPVLFVNSTNSTRERESVVSQRPAGSGVKAAEPRVSAGTRPVAKDKDAEDSLLNMSFVSKKHAENGKTRETREQKAQKPQKPEKTAAPKKKASGRTVKDSGKKYISKKSMGSLKNILLIVAAVLVVALLVIKFWPHKAKAPEEWAAVEEGSDVYTLMQDYFTAKTEGNATAMRKVLIPDAKVNASTLGFETQVYKSYENIKIYQYPGLTKGEYALCATYDVSFVKLDSSPVPSMNWFYARPDGNGKLKLLTMSELDDDSEVETYNYLVSICQTGTLINDVQAKVTNDNKALLAADTRLAAYMDNLRNGNYTVPEAPETQPAETDPEQSFIENPEQPTEAPQPTEPTTNPWEATGSTLEDNSHTFCGYISGDGVRVRSTPDNSNNDNVIGSFDKGYYVYVLGETDDWYHISDVMKKNDATGADQDPSGNEGYVYKSFLVKSYSELP